MAVMIGSARIDERGDISGGSAGDQTGKEVCAENWYLHPKGWVVLRAKDPAVAEKIAQDMQWACDNQNIGYDQDQRDTLYSAAKKVGFNCSKVTTKCETDCSALVRVCVNYAGITVGDFYTGNEVAVLMKTGQFEELTAKKYTESSSYLQRGDILVTKSTYHTAVVLSNGSKVPVEPEQPVEPEKPAQKVAYAESKDPAIAGSYRIITDLYLRTAPVDGEIILVMKKDKTCRNYGYYTEVKGVKWFLVSYSNKSGFCSSKYLKKV